MCGGVQVCIHQCTGVCIEVCMCGGLQLCVEVCGFVHIAVFNVLGCVHVDGGVYACVWRCEGVYGGVYLAMVWCM